MATIGKVSAVFTASTSGLLSGTQAAGAAFRTLGGDAKGLQSSLSTLQSLDLKGTFNIGPASSAAAAAFQQLSASAESLHASLTSGAITADQFRESMAALTQQASVQAQVFSEGAATTAQFVTAEEAFAARSASLTAQLEAGAISAQTFDRAMAAAQQTLGNANGETAAAEAAFQSLAQAQSRGEAITRSVMTAEEKHAATLDELSSLLRAGAISQQTFDRAADASAKSMRNASGSAKQLDSGLSGVSSRLNVLIGINAAQFFGQLASSATRAVSSMISMGQAQAEVIDSTSKLAARLGMNYGELAGIALAGDLAGVGLETIGAAATKADVAFVKASQGSKTATSAFANLGLTVQQLSGMNAADRFEAIASSIAALPTEAERAAAAVQIFGRSGAQLLPLFAGGAEGIAKAREEAERFGLALTNAQGQDVEEMNDAFTRAQKAVAGVVQQVTAYLAPAVKAVADTFSNLVGSIGGANIGQAIGDGLLQGARFLAQIGDFLIQNFGSTFTYLSQVGQQWGVVGDFFNRTANFLSGVFNAAQAGLGFVILGFTGAFEGLATIAQQIGQFLGFDTSTLDAVVAGAQAFNQEISNGITENLTQAQAGFAAAFADNATPVGAAIAGPLTTALDSAIAQAEASAAQIDEVKPAPIEVQQTVEFAGVNEAIKGIDSRSKEGVAEMFRLMRGTGQDVQQQQLGVLEHIADTLDSQESDYPFAIDGA